MRKSKTLKKIRNDQPVRMCGLGHYIPAFVRNAAHYDYDCIWLDLEHRTMDNREIQAILAFCHLYDIDCLLRPPTTEMSRLYRYLEDGATGLMIPFVSTAKRARELVRAVKFPPLGDRGIDAAGLDADFSTADPQIYTQHANQETFLVAQIETPKAVENVEEIAAVSGLDALFVGPTDLMFRVNADSENELTLETIYQRVSTACQKHGKCWGRPIGDEPMLREVRDHGATLLMRGSEFGGWLNELQTASQELDRVQADN